MASRERRLMWSVAWKKKDEMVSGGDDFAVVEYPDRVVLALVDGSGSGAEAAAAARNCLDEVQRQSAQGIEALFAAVIGG